MLCLPNDSPRESDFVVWYSSNVENLNGDLKPIGEKFSHAGSKIMQLMKKYISWKNCMV